MIRSRRARRERPLVPTAVALSLACLAAAIAGRAGAAEPPVATRVAPAERFAELRRQLMARVAGGELPSVAVAAFAGGELVWQEAIGWADRERSMPATPDTAYAVASLGKSILSTAVMTLLEDGRIRLEDPVDRHLAPARLTAFEGGGEPITVRHLLDMTAAVPHGWLMYADPDAAPLSPAELVERYGISVFPPGEVYLYSNLAYGVLERLVETVSGLSYGEFLHQRVFAPLAMEHGFVGPPPAGAAVATPYSATGAPLPFPNSAPRSSLGTWASLEDLVRYGRFHLGRPAPGQRPILSPATLRLQHRLRSAAPFALGALGWGSIELGDDLLWLLSNGRMSGYTSTLALFPEQGVMVVCLANVSSESGVTDEIATAVAGELVPGLLERIQQAMEAWEAATYRPYRPGAELAGEWVGAVRTPDGEQRELRLVFQPDGDVHVRLAGQLPTLLDGVAWEEGLLTGSFAANLLTEAGPVAQQITLGMRLAGEALSGYASAAWEDDRGRFSLPSYVRLVRKRELELE